jgi:hypothetical protein
MKILCIDEIASAPKLTEMGLWLYCTLEDRFDQKQKTSSNFYWFVNSKITLSIAGRTIRNIELQIKQQYKHLNPHRTSNGVPI